MHHGPQLAVGWTCFPFSLAIEARNPKRMERGYLSATRAQPAQRQSKHLHWFVQRARDAGKEDMPCWASDQPPRCPCAWLSPTVFTRVWMCILVLGIIFYCWEASFAALPLYDNFNHSWLFLSCLMFVKVVRTHTCATGLPNLCMSFFTWDA